MLSARCSPRGYISTPPAPSKKSPRYAARAGFRTRVVRTNDAPPVPLQPSQLPTILPQPANKPTPILHLDTQANMKPPSSLTSNTSTARAPQTNLHRLHQPLDINSPSQSPHSSQARDSIHIRSEISCPRAACLSTPPLLKSNDTAPSTLTQQGLYTFVRLQLLLRCRHTLISSPSLAFIPTPPELILACI